MAVLEESTTEKDISKCIEIYKEQLIQGNIRYAYIFPFLTRI